jgi:adenosylhomocysteinase
MERLKDGCVIANSGHFNSEINLAALDSLSTKVREVRPEVAEHTLASGRRIYLLSEGRLLNLAAAEGHPAAVMDMSFANQALSIAHMASSWKDLAPGVHEVPADIDAEVARLKLASLGVNIDTLTEEQLHYLSSWEQGTS